MSSAEAVLEREREREREREEEEVRFSVHHVEDEEDWSEIIEGAVKRTFPKARYHRWTVPLKAALVEILAEGQHGVLIVDLRFGSTSSQYTSLLTLFDQLDVLSLSGVEIFVVSGFLSEAAVALLEERGLDGSRIFEKDSFNAEQFAQGVSEAVARLTDLSVESKAEVRRTERAVYTLEAALFEIGAPSTKEARTLRRAEPYVLRVAIEGEPNSSRAQELDGSPVVLTVVSDSVSLDGSCFVLRLPGPGKHIVDERVITVPKGAEVGEALVDVLAFHRNHLITNLRLGITITD